MTAVPFQGFDNAARINMLIKVANEKPLSIAFGIERNSAMDRGNLANFDCMGPLLGKDAPNLSPAVMTRLTSERRADYDVWQKRDLWARPYAYAWADTERQWGVHFTPHKWSKLLERPDRQQPLN
jgi:hypothetical protein